MWLNEATKEQEDRIYERIEDFPAPKFNGERAWLLDDVDGWLTEYIGQNGQWTALAAA